MDRKIKVLIIKKNYKVCLSGSVTDSTDNKNSGLNFPTDIYDQHPPPAPPQRNLQSLALVIGGTRTPGITFDRGAQLQLHDCQSQNASESQARRCRANQ